MPHAAVHKKNKYHASANHRALGLQHKPQPGHAEHAQYMQACPQPAGLDCVRCLCHGRAEHPIPSMLGLLGMPAMSHAMVAHGAQHQQAEHAVAPCLHRTAGGCRVEAYSTTTPNPMPATTPPVSRCSTLCNAGVPATSDTYS